MLERLRRRSLRLLRRVPPPLLERAVRLGTPSYTLGTACLLEHDGRVLLVKTSYRRTWSLPGGLLDRGERPADGVRREVREEVGLDVAVADEPIVVLDLEGQLVEFFFRAELAPAEDPATAYAASPEIEEVAWVSHDEARLRVHGHSHLRRKFAAFDDTAPGGLVVLERGRGRRRDE